MKGERKWWYERLISPQVCETWPDLHIKQASIDDLSFVVDLAERVFRIYGPYGQILLIAFLQSDVVTLLACDGNKRVGFAMISPVVQKLTSRAYEVELFALAVHPKYQGRGAGRGLLREAMRFAEHHGAHHMILHTAGDNAKARGLFLSEGFLMETSIRKYYTRGQTALRMHRELKRQEHLSSVGQKQERKP
jgi:ribosomal protein S18 acetylase RimI-like enzyme